MRRAYQKHGRWILAFALATSHLFVTGGAVHAGIEDYLDRFDTRSYANSDGSLVWTGPWEEVGETTDPLAGDWQVVEDVGFAQYALGKKGAEGLGVQRVADLSGFGSATLEFEYRRNFMPSGKCVEAQVSATGTAGPWTTVHTICGVSPPDDDPAYIPVSVDISSFVSTETAIRFLHPSTSSTFGTPMALYIDDVEVFGNVTGNSAPVLAPIGHLTRDEGSLIGFTAAATDPDPGDSLTFSLGPGAPTGASITTAGVFTWTPTEAQGPGSYQITIQVVDDGVPALSDSETITVTVDETDTAPVVTSPGDQSNSEGDPVSIAMSGTDPDVPANTLTWSATGLPAGLSIDSSTGEIWGLIDYDAAASSPYSVQVTVDDGGLDASTSFQWTVTNGNREPVLDSIGSVSGDELSPISFAASATDPDGDNLTFSLADTIPTGATITSGGLFTWTPTESQGPGTYTFDVVVTDDGAPSLSDTETMTITVQEVNAPPTLTARANVTNSEGDTISLAMTASDSDAPANTLSWSATGLPPGLSMNSSTGRISGTLTYAAASDSPYTTEITATDGSLDVTTWFQWTVLNTNRAPTLSEMASLSGDEGNAIVFDATAADPDGDELTFSLGGSVPPGASIESDGSFSWTPSESQGPGSYTFEVVVTDGATPGLTDTKTIEIAVREVNLAPTAAADRYTVTQGGTLSIAATGVTSNDFDPDHHTLTAWLVSQSEKGVVELDADGSFVYTHSGDSDEDDFFTYRISDGHGGHATAVVTITVEPLTNRAPLARHDSIRLEEDSVVSIDVLGNDSDPDGDVLTVTAVALGHGGVASIEDDGSIRLFPNRDFHGTIRAAYTIEDDKGASAGADVVFEVTPVNDAPIAVADHVVMSQYLSQHVEVLANDIDPDNEPLALVSTGAPGEGETALDGEGIVYTAPKGWTGTTSFTYVVADGSGETSQGVVTVEVPQETLLAARQLSTVLGTEQLKSEWIDSQFESKLDLAISPLMGLQLFVQAFFQSLDGIELSLALLGITAVVLAGFSLVSRLPLVVPFGSPRYWSAVLVGRESQLEIRENPNRSSNVIYQLRPATKGIESEPARRLMPRGWIPVETPRGQGWAETGQLTEQVDAQSFLEDQRPRAMVDKLAAALMRNKDIGRLLGRRGLIVDLGDGVEVISPEAVGAMFRGGLPWTQQTELQAEFMSEIVDPFLEAYRASGEISAESSHSPSVLLPTEILNFRYLTVGASGVGSWLVLFEYEKGRPRIVGILRDQ